MVVETSLIMGGSVGLLLVVVRMRTSGKNVVRGEMERERAHTHTHYVYVCAAAATARRYEREGGYASGQPVPGHLQQIPGPQGFSNGTQPPPSYARAASSDPSGQLPVVKKV